MADYPKITTRPAEPRLALERDVNSVYKRGLPRTVGRDDLPALVALAETVTPTKHTGDSDYYASLVERLLHRAIEVAIQRLSHIIPKTALQLRKGLQELFNVGTEQEHVEGMGRRLESAALALDFKNGESLRRTMRGEEKLSTVICNAVTDALYNLAQQKQFSYEDSISSEEWSVPWLVTVSERPLLPDGKQALRIFYVGRMLYEELATFSVNGFDSVFANQELTPAICAIARVATSDIRSERSDLTAQGLEEVFMWAIQRTPSKINNDGAAALFGLMKGRGEDSETRMTIAALLHGYDNSQTFVFSQKLAAVLTYTRNQFLKLTAEMKFWPKTPDPDGLV